MLTINIDIARRFILGKQGLWPGRRWRAITGTEQATCNSTRCKSSLAAVTSRCTAAYGYAPGMWEDVTYEQRKFFDWCGWLAGFAI